mmetsp:Transcript_37104/g.118234  ORF Transcript_37104/g.118234 Transcript_37104/m.118234 type:complete len:271 (-) Transcript_37104:178-990(-)
MLRSLYRCAMASTATSPPDWQKTCCIWTERGMVEVSPLWYGSSSRSCGGSSSEAEWCTTSSSRAGTTWPYEEEPRTATPPPVAAAARLPRLYGSELWCCRRPIVCAPVRAAAPPAASDAACSPERRPASHAPGEALRSPSPPPAPATGGWTVMQLLTLPRLSRTVGAVWSCRHCPSTMNLYWWLPGCRLTVLYHSPPVPICRHCIGIFCHCVKEPQMYAVLPPCGQCRLVATVPARGSGDESRLAKRYDKVCTLSSLIEPCVAEAERSGD